MAISLRACGRYLLHFAHEHLEFRLPEVRSIASLFGFNIDIIDFNPESPFAVVDLPSEDCVKKLMSRAVLVKSVFELWSTASSSSQLCSNLRALPAEFIEPYTRKNVTFRIIVDSFNRKLPFPEKVKKIEDITSAAIEFQGELDLTSPDHSFHLLEYYGPQDGDPTAEPVFLYFGRWLGEGRREDIRRYHLTSRKFIGNTSMDACLSLIMGNMGRVASSSLAFDPFVGTGSLLVACAHYGAYVLGTDIDYNIIYGKGKASRRGQKWRGPDDSIRANLKQYDLEHLYIDALLADASKHAMWRAQPVFDAIVTDPPYGIREQTKKVGSKKKGVFLADEHKDGHIPEKVTYDLLDILRDLLNFAAQYLRIDGRLVFWLPVYRPDYSERHIPQHSCFRLVANSEQVLSGHIGRRLITLEKVKECKEEDLLKGVLLSEDAQCLASFRDKYFSATEERSSSSKSKSRSRSRSRSPKHGSNEERLPDCSSAAMAKTS